ncbi:hypothetical protein BJQ94_02010 [Cryobacterium sp. SO2]|uniref:hypothetical protein n=1 Tax=Cryobacterium sp. SO2 TaxID=1897060 RepID=UPI00223D9C59|nr:hypothetical protein [Cryobacterium sp. SO2]WEO77844.1 hypothetical protein BJQ94_02010 [Cryobacterium sp. SO2]
MTTALQAPVRPSDTVDGRLSWASPADGLWVASRSGDFAGFVELRNGRFEVTDGLGARRPGCGTLHEARAALAEPRRTGPAGTPVRSHLTSGLVGAALSLATIALGFLRF